MKVDNGIVYDRDKQSVCVIDNQRTTLTVFCDGPLGPRVGGSATLPSEFKDAFRIAKAEVEALAMVDDIFNECDYRTKVFHEIDISVLTAMFADLQNLSSFVIDRYTEFDEIIGRVEDNSKWTHEENVAFEDILKRKVCTLSETVLVFRSLVEAKKLPAGYWILTNKVKK